MAKKTKKSLKNTAYFVVRNQTKQEIVNVIFPNGLEVGTDNDAFKNGAKVHGNVQVRGTLNATDIKIAGTSVAGGGTSIFFEPPVISMPSTTAGRVPSPPATSFTQVSISSSTTFTWGGHNSGRLVSDNTSYEIVSAGITGICDNSSATTLTATITDAAAEGDESYTIDLKNSGATTILRFTATKVSDNAKLLVTVVAEHATGTEDWTTALITVPIKTSSSTTNKVFTVEKNIPGVDADDAFTIFSSQAGQIIAGTVASNAAVTDNAADFVLIKGQRANTTIVFNGSTSGAEGTTADRFALDVETDSKVTGKSYATDGSERNVRSTWNSGGTYIELRDNSTSGAIIAKLTVSDTGNDAKLLLSAFATQCNSKNLQSIHIDVPVDVFVNSAAVTGYPISLTISKNIPGAAGAAGDDGDDGAAGASTPDFSFTNPVITVDTDDTGGALDDGGDLASADISSQAFTKADVNAGTTNVTFAGHGLASASLAANNTYRLITNAITAVTDNGTNVASSITTSSLSGVGDETYDIFLNNAAGGAVINLDITADSSDLKIKVDALTEHETGTDDYNSIKISIPLRMQTAAGTQTITRVLTVQKIKKGTTGSTGAGGTVVVPLTLGDSGTATRAVGHKVQTLSQGIAAPSSSGVYLTTFNISQALNTDATYDSTTSTGLSQAQYNQTMFARVPSGGWTITRITGSLTISSLASSHDFTYRLVLVKTDNNDAGATNQNTTEIANLLVDGGTTHRVNADGVFIVDTGVGSVSVAEGHGLGLMLHVNAIGTAGTCAMTADLLLQYSV